MYLKNSGEDAIKASHRLLAAKRRGDLQVPELSVDQIEQQMSLAVDRVMVEGGLYDRTLAALAIKQSQGDVVEAASLMRATRATLERFGASEPVDPGRMTVQRRISTTHKDIPGGQILGPTYDYTHRLLDFDTAVPEGLEDVADELAPLSEASSDLSLDVHALTGSDFVEVERDERDFSGDADHTDAKSRRSSDRGERLRRLASGDEGFLLGVAYSSMRGYGNTKGLVGEIRYGDVMVEFTVPELGIVVGVGDIELTECQTLHPFFGSRDKAPEFSRGYGLTFGQAERKAISMAVVDRALRGEEFEEEVKYPVQDEAFVLPHADSVSSSGVVQVLKLAHYVHFQGHLQELEALRARHKQNLAPGEEMKE
ncbi:carbon-phosphorus lyase complex subunit PhnI [Phyllobacterium sophorae]|uniref:Carbon-phosphorus lyase complex subunit PhnI n=1 Tax=Phyllobacterium sophorae TaxID=1520277 RepID=A0A2P7AQK0_9HYPH|nr:carbon-phosphorus lyase complex subunit PhnI [Phyllobacterium sophorae]PSH56499.1 carbon-phosphorus lyase complex subunit PhnI [Phyllobacterium sophorae]